MALQRLYSVHARIDRMLIFRIIGHNGGSNAQAMVIGKRVINTDTINNVVVRA